MLDTLGRRNRKLPDYKCPNCGKKFRPHRKQSRYCSRRCQWDRNGSVRRLEVWWHDQRGYIQGRVVESDGTVRRIKQHRWVMEKILGRQLLPTEDVHHKNGNKLDNRPENLEVIDHAKHTILHTKARWRIWWEQNGRTKGVRAPTKH